MSTEIDNSLKKTRPKYLFLIPLAVVIATLFLFFSGPGDHAERSVRELWSLGHVAYFALVVYQLIEWKLLEKFRLRVQWVIFLLFTLLLGTSIELLQYGTNRTPDVGDISRDIMGCLLVLAFYPGMLVHSSRQWVRNVRFTVIVLFFFHLLPFSQSLLDEINARLQFPVLSDFETAFELDRWTGSATREVVNLDPLTPSHQLKIGYNTELYSSASMQYLIQDWSQYTTLNFRILQPLSEPLRISIRVHDEQHQSGLNPFQHNDRFNRSFYLKQGWNDITIPLQDIRMAAKSRQIDLSRIRNINLFTTRLSEAREIFIEEIFLTD